MIEHLRIDVEPGVALEAEIFVPVAPRAAMVIGHPNPLMGGDMHTPVVAALWNALPVAETAGIRFNFRGTGSSTGAHDQGPGEVRDFEAAATALVRAAGDVALLVGGWSFGADISLAVARPDIAGWLLAAAPFKVFEPETMAARLSPAPKRFIVPQHDHICGPKRTTEVTATWPGAELVVIDGTDHFFGGALDDIAEQLRSFVDETT